MQPVHHKKRMSQNYLLDIFAMQLIIGLETIYIAKKLILMELVYDWDMVLTSVHFIKMKKNKELQLHDMR